MSASFLDKVFADFDEAQARKDLENAQREVQAMEETLAAFNRWRGQSSETLRRSTLVQPPTNGRAGTATGGRVAIRNLIQSHGRGIEWTTPTVRDALGLDPSADHAIQVSLSRLMRNGELVRPRTGVYTLPPTSPGNGEDERLKLEVGSRHGAG